jgi:O-antigen/teichoic acid export membrane protein
MSRRKASVINLLFNYGNVVFLIINGLLLVPLYLKHFSVSTYGSFLASGNIISMIGLLDGGMSYVLTQKLSYSYNRQEFTEFNKIVTSGLIITISLSVLILLFSLSISPFISDIVNADKSEYFNIKICFLLSAISACLGIFYNNLSSVFQATLQVKYTGFSNIISIVIGLLSTLLGLYSNFGIVSIPLGFLIKSLVSFLLLIFFFIKIFYNEKSFSINIDKNNLFILVKTSLPMFGGTMAKSIINNSQLLIINVFTGPANAAIYFITIRIFQICDSFLAPIGSAIYSSISQIKSMGDYQNTKTIIVSIFEVFSGISIILLSTSYLLNGSFINLLLGQGKYGGDFLSLILAISMFFYTRFNFISVNLFAIGTFGETTMFDVLGSVFKLCLILIFIKTIGIIIIPTAEILCSVLISGIFLNRLIIKKLFFHRMEAFEFIFSGYKFVISILIFNFMWIKISNPPDTLLSFLFSAALIVLLNSILTIIVSSNLRMVILSLINNLNRKSNA